MSFIESLVSRNVYRIFGEENNLTYKKIYEKCYCYSVIIAENKCCQNKCLHNKTKSIQLGYTHVT